MRETPDSQEILSVRCPSCRQRFSVESSLMGSMVECGGCDAHFPFNDNVIVRAKRFYPGERNTPDLSKFQRVPVSAAAPPGMQQMRYVDVGPDAVGPVSPQRVLAGLIGVGLMALTALILIFSVGQNGSFSAISAQNKVIIAAFVSVLGLGLLMYANPRSKKRAAFFGILMAAGLVSIPFFYKGQQLPESTTGTPVGNFAAPSFNLDEIDPEVDLRERFTTKPLEDEQARMEKLGNGRKAFGIYLTNLIPRNIYMVRDYLIRDSEAGASSHPFPRDDGDYLMVLTEVNKAFDEVVKIAARLGEAAETYPDIGVIVVRVNNDQFEASADDKLNNVDDPAFYGLNQYELNNIDLDRVERAVERLANAEPKIFRSDISKKLVEIMTQTGVDFHDILAKALIKWAEEPGPAGKAGVEAIRKLIEKGDPVPESLVELVAKEETGEAIPLVNQLWLQTPSLWEPYFTKFGSAIEPLLLKQINSKDAPLQRSAIKLLGKAGSAASLPALQALINSDNAEVRVLTERSIEAIKSR